MASVNHKYDQEMLSVDRDFIVSHWSRVCVCVCVCVHSHVHPDSSQESCEVARDRMRSEIEDKTRRLKEEKILLQMAKGLTPLLLLLLYFLPHLFLHFILINTETSSKKRKLKASEFLLPDKRKKPVTVTDIHSVTIISSSYLSLINSYICIQ